MGLAEVMGPIVRRIQPTIQRRDDIDGLRGVAVTAVVLFHAHATGFGGGFIGVDVFFVISGFVIALSLLRSWEQGRASMVDFYARRARRLLPALAVVALATFAAALFLTPAQLFGPLCESLPYTAFFASNVYFWKHNGYWSDPTRPLLHTWSLGVEEQYYLVAPILTFAAIRWLPPKRRALGLVPFLAASFVLSLFVTGRYPFANFFSLPTRAWEILLGTWLALSVPLTPVSAVSQWGLSLAGTALVRRLSSGTRRSRRFPD